MDLYSDEYLDLVVYLGEYNLNLPDRPSDEEIAIDYGKRFPGQLTDLFAQAELALQSDPFPLDQLVAITSRYFFDAAQTRRWFALAVDLTRRAYIGDIVEMPLK